MVKVNQSVQDYLKTIYEIQNESGRVATSVLAKQMRITPASVTGMIKKLADLSLVSYAPYKGIRLTSHGKKIALQVLRYHRLIELFLVEALDMSWDEVHFEADKLEHVMSAKLIERIDKFLGHPALNPHGAPIPDRYGHIDHIPMVKLTDMNTGQNAVIAQVEDRDSEKLVFLAESGIVPGTRIKVVASFNNSMTIKVENMEKLIDRKVAGAIFTKDVSNEKTG